MNFKDRLVFFYVIFVMLEHQCALLTYLFTATYVDEGLKIFAMMFWCFGVLANPFLMLYFAKKFSSLGTLKFVKRSLVFFPLMVLGSTTFLAVNPRVMRRLLKIMGIRETNYVLYAVVWVFYGMLLKTGVIDAFCQALILGNNIQFKHDNSFTAQYFIWSVIVVVLSLFSVSMCCCLDVIVVYLEQYTDMPPLRDKLLKPAQFVYEKEELDEICIICRDDFKAGESMGTLPSCEHYFHYDCLEKWLRWKEVCPLCRNEIPS